MAELDEIRITLNSEEWLDAPSVIIEKLKDMSSQNVMIDASSREPICTQIAQLLLAAKKSASANKGKLIIQVASFEFIDSLNVLGLLTEFEELDS